MPAVYRSLFAKYQCIIKQRISHNLNNSRSDVDQWQDRLFIKFLTYCLPVSLIAFLPCVYISFKYNYTITGVIDIFCFLTITAVTLSKKLKIKQRKILVISAFYTLAIFLTAVLGYLGPGVFYLFAITILSSLIFPVRLAWGTIALNALILFGFALFIYLGPGNNVLSKQYSIGQWLAFGSNLIFLSILLVVLIDKIFNGLQTTINITNGIKEKYKTIFESSPLPMWLFDTESLQFLDVNDAATKHYGYSKQEFLAKTIRDIRPPEYVAGIEYVVKLNKDNAKFHHQNTVHLKKNGEQINVKIESTLLDFNGRQAKLVLATDITAQVKSEQKIKSSNMKIKQSESNLRAIFDNTNEGFVLLDIDNRIIAFNSKATEFIIFNAAYAKFEAGRSIFDFVDEARKIPFNDILQKVHNKQVVEYDQRLNINGVMCWIHFTLTPVYESGVIAGTCITGRDITEYKKYVQTIESQNKKFKEISWIQSHLVRAPLARVMGLATLLAAETNEKEKDEMLKMLQASSAELDDIIKDITKKTAVDANAEAERLSTAGY
ncbi:PAS domain-containing protein [Mucilaginibacter flavidus]|uniref:PAS domain-containing protein n=1 Tax=Mucilaginibacter flavidus TaxID=2949309 RepID=UPI002092162E|nr:PAS domain-containing sensor histidine kinase [Mucilaginibacter flavidus]MCO5945538.1 PAS domain S-box protein [Mucilaginibacter flavidus]